MPEGDTLWRTADRLHRALAGQPLVAAELRWPSLATAQLQGMVTLEVRPRGKHLLHRLDSGLTLHSHLRMEGQWRIAHPGPPTQRLLARHDVRAYLATAQWSALGLRLGMLDLVSTARENDLVGHLGPDLLDPGWDATTLRDATRRVAAYEGSIGDALLDQRTVAGIGTYWASETLFVQRILPWTPVADLTEDPDLVAEVELAVKDANQVVSKAEAIRTFRILPVDFTEDTGELTPTLKVKRKVVVEKFAAQIAAIYS